MVDFYFLETLSKCPRSLYYPLLSFTGISFHKLLTNVAKRLKAISLAKAVNYCLQSHDSDLDSSVGGFSSDEEEKVDNVLLEDYSNDSNRLVLVILFKIFSFYLFYDKNLVLIYYSLLNYREELIQNIMGFEEYPEPSLEFINLLEILLQSTFHNFLIQKGIVKYAIAKAKKN